MQLQTEFEFKLPKGYVDKNGELYSKGVMRMATAADEIIPMRDPRVQQNPSYLTIVILSRVIIRLGPITEVTTGMIERLFSADLAFLNDMYQKINGLEKQSITAVCPGCGMKHEVPLNFTRGE